MYVVESKGGAIACMLLALLFLGTWPAIMTLLERRGRLPQHTYLDYTMTNLLAAVIIALTFGEIGKSTFEMPNFLSQLSQLKVRHLISVQGHNGIKLFCPVSMKFEEANFFNFVPRSFKYKNKIDTIKSNYSPLIVQ